MEGALSTLSLALRPIGDIIITPRPLADYWNMFMLTDADLAAGPILDCPAGASPFGAQVRARGGTVISVDPAYELPPRELLARTHHDLARAAGWAAQHLANFDWSYFGSPESLRHAWEVAVDLFAADYAPDGDRYVAAGLPTLPFPDGHFHLALSSHLLFNYPEHLSFADHVGALLELVRVTQGDVRVYPLVDTAGTIYPRLDEVRSVLAEHRVQTETHAAAYTFLPGGDRMLACRRDPAR